MNRQTKIAWMWAGVSMASSLGVILPFAVGMSPMGGGFAIAFVSGFLILVGMVAAVVFALRARTLDHLLSGRDILVHWTYPAEEQAARVKKEWVEERAASWGLFGVIAVISLVIGIAFLIADPDAGRFVLAVLMGVVGLLAVVAALAPRVRYARRRSARPEAVLSREGGYVFGVLHTWRLLGARIETAEVRAGGSPTLQITYSAPAIYGKMFVTRQSFDVRVPIPPGETERAHHIADALIASKEGKK